MLRRLVALLLLLALPLAGAQNASTDDLPVGTGPPAEDESTEGAEGFAYGGAIVLGTILFAGVLAFVVFRQRRNPPRNLRR